MLIISSCNARILNALDVKCTSEIKPLEIEEYSISKIYRTCVTTAYVIITAYVILTACVIKN